MKIHYFEIIANWPTSNQAIITDDTTSVEEAFKQCYPESDITKYSHEEFEVKAGLMFDGWGYDACGINFESEPQDVPAEESLENDE